MPKKKSAVRKAAHRKTTNPAGSRRPTSVPEPISWEDVAASLERSSREVEEHDSRVPKLRRGTKHLFVKVKRGFFSPVRAAELLLFSNGERKREVTDSNGNAHFAHIREGNYTLQLLHDGVYEKKIVIHEETTKVTFSV